MKFITAISFLLSTSLAAQTTGTTNAVPAEPFIFGEVLTFRSKALDQERVLNVYLPDGYADSTLSYPVIYVLDGSKNEDFPHIAGLVQFMNMYDLMPKSIVVGIANNGPSRYHDFTGPTENDSDKVWLPTYGGSAAFIGFLEKEVQPMVRDHYRTSGHRTLIGQSLGGLLATEVLFSKPELFDDFILVSPSLWWNNGTLAANMDGWVKAHATLSKRVFVATASNDTMMQLQIDEMVQAFRTHAMEPFTYWYVPFPEESHATILHRAVYKAFEVMGAQ